MVKTGRGGSGDGDGGGETTNRRQEGGAWAARAWLQRTEKTRVEARGDGAACETGGVGCRAERRFRSGGFRTELRRWTAADGGGRRRTAGDSGGQRRRTQTVADSVRIFTYCIINPMCRVLRSCLTVLGSSETRLTELRQPRTAAVTNGDQPRTTVTDQMRQKPERDRPALIPT